MNYEAALDAALGRLHGEGRYRTFINIERKVGEFVRSCVNNGLRINVADGGQQCTSLIEILV